MKMKKLFIIGAMALSTITTANAIVTIKDYDVDDIVNVTEDFLFELEYNVGKANWEGVQGYDRVIDITVDLTCKQQRMLMQEGVAALEEDLTLKDQRYKGHKVGIEKFKKRYQEIDKACQSTNFIGG